MATKAITFYVHAYFDTEGKFVDFTVEKYKMDEGMGKYGMWVSLGKQEVRIQVPDDHQLINMKGAEELEKFIREEQGKHQLHLMKLQSALNAMRGLTHQEILDPVDKPKAPIDHQADDVLDDDIPF